jgi:predicted nucleic acid-binding protein
LAQADPKADLVIIDDNAAKKTAKYLGLTVTGTLGVLIKAKQSGIISSVKNAITKIQSNGFYINENIIKLALKQAGEL